MLILVAAAVFVYWTGFSVGFFRRLFLAQRTQKRLFFAIPENSLVTHSGGSCKNKQREWCDINLATVRGVPVSPPGGKAPGKFTG